MERECSNCKLFSPGTISLREVLEYANRSIDLFGEEKAEDILKYILSIKNSGGGKRTCSFPRPFTYKNEPCISPNEFSEKINPDIK